MNLNYLNTKLNKGEKLNELEQAWFDWLTSSDENSTSQQRQDVFKQIGKKSDSPDYAPTWKSACPAELRNTSVIKNSTARKFDEGVTLSSNAADREANTWIVDSDSHIPFALSAVVAADIQRADEYYVHKNAEPGVSSNQFTPYEKNDKLQGYGIGQNCSTLINLREQREYQCWIGTYPTVDTDDFTLIKLGNGVAVQAATFGLKGSKQANDRLDSLFGIGRAKHCKKYEAKTRALDNALSKVFSPRPKYASDNTLTLDTCPVEGEESSWTPVSGDPLDQLIADEEFHHREREARLHLTKIRDHLGPDKWVLLMASLEKTNAEIAAECNANGGDTNAEAVKKRVQRVRKALQTLSCPL